jgi:hypothetical protein
VHRRQILAGVAALVLPAGCAASAPEDAVAPSSPPSRFAWFPTAGGLVDVYALTWVEGLSPAQVVTRAGGRRIGPRRWPRPGWNSVPGVHEKENVLAVTRAGGWALMVEDRAPIGADDDTIGKLSKATRLVTFSHNSAAADRFVLASDGTILVDFDPGYPPDRAGSRPDLLVDQMRAVGLEPTLQETPRAYVPPELACLDLTERLTGVPLTLHLLHDSTYLAAAVAVPTDNSQQTRPHGS